jgi:hypothetical protein
LLKRCADRVDKMSNGRIKIETLPDGAIAPAFEILDAASACSWFSRSSRSGCPRCRARREPGSPQIDHVAAKATLRLKRESCSISEMR